MKAFLLAAGKGTRLKPFTDHHPKALAKVNGFTLLERNIKYLQGFGLNEFVINIHHYGEQIEEFLSQNQNFGSDIAISNEKEELLETGGALLFAKELLGKEDILMMNADILTNLNIKEMLAFHSQNNKAVTLAVSDRESSRKLLFDENMLLKGWKNISTGETKPVSIEPNLQEFAFSGIHIISAEFLTQIGRRGKFSIIDEYLDHTDHNLIQGFMHQADLIDVGKPEAIAKAEKLFL